MRILTVVTEAPPVRSGIAEVAHRVTAGLRSVGHDVDLFTTEDVGRRQFGEIRLTGLARHWRRLRANLAGYDVVNLHGPAPTFSDAFLALWHTLPRAQRPGLVYTHHSDIDILGARGLSRVYNRIHGLLARSAYHVVVSTESYRGRAAGANSNVDVVPFGIDEIALGTPRRAARFTVAFIGQLRPYKGVDVLLRAAAALPDVQFEIAGTGHQEQALHELHRRLNLTNVHWHGKVTDAERDAILHRAHVIALPSLTRAEAFGIVLLEGMRAGAVPVASSLPGVLDIAGESGLICEPGNPRSLIQAIAYLRDEPAEWRSRSAWSKEAAGRYRWDATVRSYHRLLTDAAMESRFAGIGAVDLRPAMAMMRDAALADRASLMLLDPSAETLHLANVSGSPLPAEAHREPFGLDGFAGRALWTGQPYVVSESTETLGIRRRADIHAALCIPFAVHDGEVRGVVNFARMRSVDFLPVEVGWMSDRVRQVASRVLVPRPGALPAIAASAAAAAA